METIDSVGERVPEHPLMSAAAMKAPKAAPWFGVDRKGARSYRGLRMKTDTHLHEQLEEQIAGLLPARTEGRASRVLDLGCGEGAFSERLSDLGYEVVSVDVDAESFRADGPRFVALDFNDRTARAGFLDEHRGTFDLILAVEVIEHLWSPYDFLRFCRDLCSGHTRLLATTPNVGSWWSRLWFLLTGELWGFNPESWAEPGHVHGITSTEMRGLLRENGFECLQVVPGGNLPVFWAYNLKRLVASVAMLPLRPFMRGEKDGWVLCYHARPIV